MEKMELRINPSEVVTNDDGSMTVSGYVNRTDSPSNMLGARQKFIEKISKGAWQRALERGQDIHFLAEHDNSKILASTRNGSLSLREDDQGLYMEATISPTSWGKDYYQLISDGILSNMSFGFRSIKDSWRNMGDHMERTVQDLQLSEVSVVRDPAYATSSISARGVDLADEEVEAKIDELRAEEAEKIEIRSTTDLETIAQMVYNKLMEAAKGKEEQVVEETLDEELQVAEETPVTEPTKEGTDEVVEEQPVEDKPEVEEVVTEEVVEEVKEEKIEQEEIVDKAPEKTQAELLREFINNHKQEEE